MVAIAQDVKCVDEAVCPNCFNAVRGVSVWPVPDRYKRTIRCYMAWCTECNAGYEVVQFFKDEKWRIHKYRYYGAIVPLAKAIPDRQWRIVEELPKAPVCVTGPGGDFDKAVDIKAVNLVKDAYEILAKVAKALGTLLESQTGEQK